MNSVSQPVRGLPPSHEAANRLGPENKASQDHEAKTWTIGCPAPNQNPLLLLSTWEDGVIASFPAKKALVLLLEGRAVSVVESGSEQGRGQVISQAPGEGGRGGVLGVGVWAAPSLASNVDGLFLLIPLLLLIITAALF